MNGRVRALTKPKLITKAAAEHRISNVVAFMDAHVDEKIKRLQMYPAPKAGSNYVRTGTLRDSWRTSDTKLTSSGLIKRVFNDARYAGFVHGDEAGVGQQAQHKTTGWPLFAEVLRAGFTQGVKRALRQ